jgi:hypothetical protein
MAQSELPTQHASRDATSSVERPSGERPAAAVPAAHRARSARWRFAPKVREDLARRAIVPLAIALVPLFWVLDATHRASLTTLGRDQGIFQYVAWAVTRGEVDYRDIRDVNGPLVHLLHLLVLKLGGGEEHRFHQIDLALTGLSFAFVGACLPGLAARARSGLPRLVERALWAATAWVVLAGQYGLYTYWNQAQRESLCDWFLLPSLGLQVLPPARSARRAVARITLLAALSVITWFGKPTFAVFTLAQFAALLLDGEIPLGRASRVASFALGGLLGSIPPLVYILRWGDLGAFLRISASDVPNVYRFIWAKSAQEILGEEGPLSASALALAAAVLVLALVLARGLPRRALVLGLAPLAGLANVLAQHKGFDYHFHPLTASTWIAALAVVVMLSERARVTARRRPLGWYGAIAAAVAVGLHLAASMRGSPHTRNVWILAGGETPERRSWEEYFATFRTNDYFPWDMRLAASYLANVTSPDARVQTYGMDPYVLFLAGRRSATPYIYAYDLNADAALEGGWSNRPTDAQQAFIKERRDEHERDMLARLRAKPPEAFVFLDHAPLITYQEAWDDFRYCCPAASRWVAENYHLARSFGEVHVWLRDGHPVKDEPGLP